MKVVYCSECGTKLNITRKALKGYCTIIDLIPPHECPEEPIDLDLTPQEVPVDTRAGEGKFVKNLNDLSLRPSVSTLDLRDRRKEVDIKSSAPSSVIQQMKQMQNSTPAKDLIDIPKEEG